MLLLQYVAKEKFIKNLLERPAVGEKVTTQTLRFAAMDMFTPNQITTLAVDHIPTILDPMFVAMETLSVNQVAVPLVAEAIITTQVLNVAAVASCTVQHLVIIAVVPQCIGILHIFAATTTSYLGHIHPIPAAVTRTHTTLEGTCVAVVIYVTNLREPHVVEQSTTIPLLMFAVATTCC